MIEHHQLVLLHSPHSYFVQQTTWIRKAQASRPVVHSWTAILTQPWFRNYLKQLPISSCCYYMHFIGHSRPMKVAVRIFHRYIWVNMQNHRHFKAYESANWAWLQSFIEFSLLICRIVGFPNPMKCTVALTSIFMSILYTYEYPCILPWRKFHGKVMGVHMNIIGFSWMFYGIACSYTLRKWWYRLASLRSRLDKSVELPYKSVNSVGKTAIKSTRYYQALLGLLGCTLSSI